MLKIDSGMVGETMYERIKRLYKARQLPITSVKNAVEKNFITEREYEIITERKLRISKV